jgi:tripeptidyl-peptidase-1
VSIIVSSADYGVAGAYGNCSDPSTSQANVSTGYFKPTFPSTCPYVTSVGGIRLPVNSSTSDQETAFYLVLPKGDTRVASSSGGGFSNVFPVPSYQLHLVTTYLSGQAPVLANISASFNSSGRGFRMSLLTPRITLLLSMESFLLCVSYPNK